MDFNISTMKNKNSQNKINTCMTSVKNIIYDYKPFESKPLKYSFWTWKGKVNKDTKIEIEGKKPAFEYEIDGTIGQYTVHCGTIKPDGYFYGRDIVLNSASKKVAIETTSWDYPKTNSYDHAVSVGTQDLSKFTIPGVNPIIVGEKYYGYKEVLYEAPDAEHPLDPAEIVFKASATDGTTTEEVSVTVEECQKYQEGICIGVVNEIANSKMTSFKLLKVGVVGTEEKSTMVVYIDEQTASKTVKVYKSPVVDKIFAVDAIDKDKTGIDPETFVYSKSVDEKEDASGVKTITTIVNQPQLVITKVAKVDNKWNTEEHYEYKITTTTETKESVVQDTTINIAVIYEIEEEEK